MSMQPSIYDSHSQRGFTLVEMSVVLLVLAILSGGLLTFISQNARISKASELRKKMDAIEEALLDFRKENNRIPCPADGTILDTDLTGHFGLEASTPGDCYSTGTIKANFSDGSLTVGGVVPTKTLGLSDDYMFDPWGGRFTYKVDIRATATNGFITYPINSPIIGSITVYDTGGGTRTSSAVAVVLSHGPNGHGAYQLSGVRKSSGSTNGAELINCGCNSATPPVADGTNYFTSAVVMGENYSNSTTSTNSFDDTIRYYTRPMLASSSDLLTELR